MSSHVPDLAKFIQIEETNENSPCSESLFQKIGGSINYILDNLLQPAVGSIESSTLSEAQFQATRSAGWVLSDGRSVVGSKYADLVANTIPDFRGYFIRGKDHGRGLNPDGNTANGTIQAPGIVAHTHVTVNNFTSSLYVGANGVTNGNNLHGVHFPQTATLTLANDGTPTDPKPKNVTVNFFIRIN